MEEKKTSPESIKKNKPNLSNDDFLKHIDEQLIISKQTHKWGFWFVSSFINTLSYHADTIC